MTDRLGWSLSAYRVIAYVVGCGLVILVCVGVPLRYLAGVPGVVEVVGPLHGFLFIVYLLASLNLAVRCRWNPVATVAVMAAGTIPFCSFVAEHYVTRWVRAHSTPPGPGQRPASATFSKYSSEA